MRIHMTNIQGLGATVLLESLLPEMIKLVGNCLTDVYVSKNVKCALLEESKSTKIHVYHRIIPNSLSRAFEVMFSSRKFSGKGAILVLGDIPLRGVKEQTVFVQTSFLVANLFNIPLRRRLKVWSLQLIFRFTMVDATQFIVQTEQMANGLNSKFGIEHEKIHVVAQPAPSRILATTIKINPAEVFQSRKMKLFYPARYYPHKNHSFLASFNQNSVNNWPVERIVLTIFDAQNPNPDLTCIDCVGELGMTDIITHYSQCDALLFLSEAESYGLPLVEAMHLGKPIICVDLPYSRELCGDLPFYFNQNDPNSLSEALVRLYEMLKHGWTPDWSSQLQKLPKNWMEVATEMFNIIHKKSEILIQDKK